jgi:hypothetical protein
LRPRRPRLPASPAADPKGGEWWRKNTLRRRWQFPRAGCRSVRAPAPSAHLLSWESSWRFWLRNLQRLSQRLPLHLQVRVLPTSLFCLVARARRRSLLSRRIDMYDMSDGGIKIRACNTGVCNDALGLLHSGKLSACPPELGASPHALSLSVRKLFLASASSQDPNFQTCTWSPHLRERTTVGRRLGAIVMLAKGGKKKKKPGTVAENKQVRSRVKFSMETKRRWLLNFTQLLSSRPSSTTRSTKRSSAVSQLL